MRELLIVLVGTGVLFIALGVPLWCRNVPPNHWYGFRVRATMNDPNVWYPVNEVSGKWMAFTGAIHGLVVCSAYLLPGMTEDRLGITGASSLVIAAIVMTVAGFVELRNQTRGK